MNYFFKNPARIYKDIEERIPSIKIKNKNFMNKMHNLNISSDFWWALSGEYAILSEYATMNLAENPRLFNELKHAKNIESEVSKEKVISAIILNSIGKECILDKNFNLNLNDMKKVKTEELLIDDEKHFIMNDKENDFLDKNVTNIKKYKESLPMINLTNFLTQLRLRKFKYLFLKIKEKIVSINKKKNQHEDKIFYSKNLDEVFESVLQSLLPDVLVKYFPKWFVWLSHYLVSSKHKWVTTFGHGRDIYQLILNAKSYQKFGTKNIQIISHGSTFSLHYWHLFRFSLFPDLKLSIVNQSLILPKTTDTNFYEDILFCPMSFPFICDSFSLSHFWKFMETYRKAIKLLNDGLENNKKIKIRYKSFKYLSGFAGPFTIEECKIPIENKRFEDVYNKYKLIVSMPFGTISAKCHQNGINCITYNYPFSLTNKQSYYKANTFPGVFVEGDEFLNELEKKIKFL